MITRWWAWIRSLFTGDKMHRTDGDQHQSNLFSNGDPAVPRAPTQVEEDWLNAVQEEIAGVVESASIALVKGTNTQLLAALVQRFLTPGVSPSYGADLTNGLLLEGRAGDAATGCGKVRVIIKPVSTDDSSEFWITINAAWSDAGPNWVKDTDGTPAVALCLRAYSAGSGGGAVSVYQQAGAGPFVDSAWLPRGPTLLTPVLEREYAVAATFSGTWANVGGAYKNAGSWADPSGVCHLEGAVVGGAIGTAICTLPAEHRPSATMFFPAVADNAAAVISINSSGVVTIVAATTVASYVSLDGISFGT